MKSVRIENPTPHQEALSSRLDRLVNESIRLNSPIDMNFLPDADVDRRRLNATLERLRDENLVMQAVLLTELAGDPNVTIV